MEYKKLLKYLQNDLSELDELISEKGKSGFDELELEFIRDRIKSAQKLIGLLAAKKGTPANINSEKNNKAAEPVHEITTQTRKAPEMENTQVEIKEEVESISTNVEEKRIIDTSAENKQIVEASSENVKDIRETDLQEKEEKTISKEVENKNNIELDEVPDEKEDKRLGDTFLKEKSVNDLMAADGKNLESKISNRPVASIKSAIGINDRFQFIRELFDGKAEQFTDTVEQLDSFGNIKEAVEYLQQNFKWKKTETSLKFVNLVKRRFPNG